MGRIFMDALDDPFAAVDRELDACPLAQVADAIVVDIHAEATSEKQAMGFHCDGRATLVVGHPHPRADVGPPHPGRRHRLPHGCGMCGDYDSVLGMNKDEPVRRFLQKTPGSRMEPASGEGTLSGIAVETDDRTGLAVRIAPVRLGPGLEETWPRFWD
jgi:calcineurin-like phosphoesterase